MKLYTEDAIRAALNAGVAFVEHYGHGPLNADEAQEWAAEAIEGDGCEATTTDLLAALAGTVGVEVPVPLFLSSLLPVTNHTPGMVRPVGTSNKARADMWATKDPVSEWYSAESLAPLIAAAVKAERERIAAELVRVAAEHRKHRDDEDGQFGNPCPAEHWLEHAAEIVEGASQ